MEFDNKVVMSIDSWRDYENDEDISIALGKVTFLSDKPNTHKHKYSIDVIRKYAPTYLGKFLVAKYDKFYNDANTHTNDQSIVGYIPTTQEVQYEKRDDGYWYASVDVVISKIYAPEIYKLFLENNYRSVSVEQLVGFSKDTEDYVDGLEEKEVIGFEGIGITILGMKFNPSIKGANIKLTRMSSDNVDVIENEYIKYSQKESNSEVISMKDIMTKLEDIEQKLNKEETMAEIKEDVEVVETEEVVLNSEEETIETEKVEENDQQVSQMSEIELDACGDEEKMEESIDSEENENVETCEETLSNENVAKLSDELKQANDKIAEYEAELYELRKFKDDAQLKEKNIIVSQTLARAKDFVEEEVYSEFVKKAEECAYNDINGWKNEVLATIADKALLKMSELTSKEDGIVDMGMPEQKETKTSIFD